MEAISFKSPKNEFSSRAFNVVIAALGVMGTVLGIYTGFFYEKKPNIALEVLSNATVLDVRENLSKLDIIYDGRNLNANNLALSVLTLKVVNNGQGDMLLSHYDDNDLLGFVIPNASLAETPTVLVASNNYLETRVRINMKSPQLVTFVPVIVEAKEFFVVKLLALHAKGVVPKIQSTGKVAGVTTKIEVTEPFREEQNEAFFKKAFQGGILVQTVRGVAYFIMSLATIVILVLIVTTWDEKTGKYKRRKLVEEFKATYEGNFDPALTAIFDKYIELGGFYLQHIQKVVEFSSNELGKLMIATSSKVSKEHRHTRSWSMQNEVIMELLDSGLMRKTDKGMALDSKKRNTLRRFIVFVQKDTK